MGCIWAACLRAAGHPPDTAAMGRRATSACLAWVLVAGWPAPGKAQWDCPAGYVGQDCDIDYDECTAFPCSNGGECSTPEVGDFLCTCTEPYSGAYCELNVVATECGGFADYSGSYGTTGANATCYAGESCEWTGGLFDTPVSDAVIDGIFNCSENCLAPDGFLCSGEDGPAPDDCESAPCQNGGSCMDSRGSYACICTGGWAGDDCETAVDLCMLYPCENGGTCVDGTCSCAAGYEGTTCSEEENYVTDIQTMIPVPETFPSYFSQEAIDACQPLCVGALWSWNCRSALALIIPFICA
eukprot:SAG22_NODE_3350_length_1763_cov_3.942308_2_plen_299_part_00